MIGTRHLALHALAFLMLAWGSPGQAQAEKQPDVVIPNYRDPSTRSEMPDLVNRRSIRFATSDGFPPFQAVDAAGQPYGLNVDLARALCEVLQLSCTVQIFAWNDLERALSDGRADAVIAGLRPTEESRRTIDFTKRYLQLPARFVGHADVPEKDVSPEALKGKTIAVVGGSAHEAFLTAFFSDSDIVSYPNDADARSALKRSETAYLFGDGSTLAAWLATDDGSCCAFRGGPYLESRYFGEGFAIGVRRGDERLRDALDHALDVVNGNGTFGTIYLKHFPIGIY